MTVQRQGEQRKRKTRGAGARIAGGLFRTMSWRLWVTARARQEWVARKAQRAEMLLSGQESETREEPSTMRESSAGSMRADPGRYKQMKEEQQDCCQQRER
jgi:hypothetical protein